MRKVVYLLMLIFLGSSLLAQTEYRESYRLSEKKDQVQREPGVYFLECNLNDYPSEKEIIGIGRVGCFVLAQVENWTEDTLWFPRTAFYSTGTYDLRRAERINIGAAPELTVEIKPDSLIFNEPHWYLEPGHGCYNWIAIILNGNDNSTGSIIMTLVNEESFQVRKSNGEKVIPSGVFPYTFWKRWVGAKTTWVDSSIEITDAKDVILLKAQISVYPNPFVESANLSLDLSTSGEVEILISDIQGRVMFVVNQEYLCQGHHDFLINTSELDRGVYFLSLRQADRVKTFKFVRE